MQSALFALLAVALLSAASAFVCPHDNGYFRHPTDQHRFIFCVDGRPFEYTCPAGLLWNQSLRRCDYSTGPLVDPTEPTVTPPHGTRPRHTDATAEPVSTLSPTEGTTRGRHH